MKRALIYHPETGQVMGRLTMSEDSQMSNYPNAAPVSNDEHFHLPLEKLTIVDVRTKKIRPLSPEEAKVLGATTAEIHAAKEAGIFDDHPDHPDRPAHGKK